MHYRIRSLEPFDSHQSLIIILDFSLKPPNMLFFTVFIELAWRLLDNRRVVSRIEKKSVIDLDFTTRVG